MNLFCFTLAGSTESLYEAAYSQTLKDVLPKYQCSPSSLLRCEPQRGGSEPSITSNAQKSKRSSRRSCLPTSPMDHEISEKHSNPICWMSSGDQENTSHQNNKETCEAPRQVSRLTRDDCDKTHAHQAAQDSETTDTAGSTHTKRRLKKSQSLVKVNKGKSMADNNDRLTDVLSNNNPVLTCIGLGKRSEKSSVPPAAPQQQQQTKHHEHSEEDDMWSPKVGNYTWSPFECSQPWSPFYTDCHQPQHELHVCGATLPPPRTTDWNRFESLMQELDVKQLDPPPPQIIHSITDPHLSQNTMTRFGRFDAFTQHSPLMKAQDDGSCLKKTEQNDHLTNSRLQEKQTEASSQRDRTHTVSPAERAVTAIANGSTQIHGTCKREAPGGRTLTRGHRKSSLESLYSLKSGQSSSSGVTSGSDWSSNRGSLRLEEDLFCARQFCGRARVHTEHTPSPYDTESLKLKVGDVIDIIAKPPMGIWTGMLNDKIGNFKFIYVDLLKEENPERQKETQIHRVRHGSTVQEALKLLNLEEFSSSLQRNGYQTVEDLMRLREHHLMELNVTDPGQRHRLLAAVDSLQRLRSECQLENEANEEAQTHAENTKADTGKCSRDSGCPDYTREDADVHVPSQQPQTTAS
ncbi:SAM domain-containing protein SAMSN-1-like [Solea senegalensis]|uniref:SAM domain-containing protein SAMSN-1-like n=1 Tax=Solea senegalensis TaxID=28829 RepID=A0AAV6SJ29_SOLSE|nr:SAM domain-containing protein SAMSN-1b isoform X2 [Solea senegalensis]KAG7517070.1 SAM domain-containing protein SAMSN-1-like [Solea senegalensis]